MGEAFECKVNMKGFIQFDEWRIAWKLEIETHSFDLRQLTWSSSKIHRTPGKLPHKSTGTLNKVMTWVALRNKVSLRHRQTQAEYLVQPAFHIRVLARFIDSVPPICKYVGCELESSPTLRQCPEVYVEALRNMGSAAGGRGAAAPRF